MSDNLNYGVVGNGRTAALISEEGSVDWLCMPDFDSPSIFAKILDKKRGGCLNFIVDEDYQISQAYLPHTNILRTLFVNKKDKSSFEVIDFMPLYKTIDVNKRYMPAELYRLIRVLNGKPRVRIDYSPKLNYARGKVSYFVGEDYIKVFSVDNPKDTIYFYSSLDLNAILNKEEVELSGVDNLLVSYNQKLVTIDPDRVQLEFERTKVYWLNWSNRSKKYTQYADYIERSMLVLKLLSYRQTGALLAALTISIPESPGGTRNWDYRYCWLRDASMSIETLLQTGHRSSARRFMNFIQQILRSKSDKFQIMYGIHGERKL
ncbi:MAG: trehalase-like domain-containing protein, partial [Bacteroidaceae bacterium]